MSKDFFISNGILKKYYGHDAHVVIPDGVTGIGSKAFYKRKELLSVYIPRTVKRIGELAFSDCSGLESINIPDSVTEIAYMAFYKCTSLTSATVPDSVTDLGELAFYDCSSLTSVNIPAGVKKIDTMTFYGCESLTSVIIPDGVTEIGNAAFFLCRSLTSVTIPDSVTRIGESVFDACKSLTAIVIPDSVTQIEKEAFDGETVTVICGEGSCAHRYCLENRITYIFDYQYEAFGGVIPEAFEMLSSPFPADEEKPYIFISYSHKDRDTILGVLKGLYESGWRIWYDEGLTIGDSYDRTLEDHVRDCSAFLLFVTHNSVGSRYIRRNEIRWAKEYGKPIIKCIIDDDIDYDTDGGIVLASVTPSGIGTELEKVGGLTKGESRTAKGISVAVDPSGRNEHNADGFAYCLYSSKGSAAARAILLDAKGRGCIIYDAAAHGDDDEKLQNSACLIVFLDKAFLSDGRLTGILTRHFLEGKEIAVCQLEDIVNGDLPTELTELYERHWLNYVHGITNNMDTKLAQYLERIGCRNTAVLPGFEYEETDRGLVITRYSGMDSSPRIESRYGGVPVVEIAEGAFKNCIRLETVEIPDGVTVIGEHAFDGCSNLASVIVPDSVTEIKAYAFQQCSSLASFAFPEGVTVIRENTLWFCTGLKSAVIPDSVTVIESAAFDCCYSLTSVSLPDSIKRIGDRAFSGCKGLTSVKIPNTITKIEEYAFNDCKSLKQIAIPDSVTEIGRGAFDNCSGAVSVIIPGRVTLIDSYAFNGCSGLSSVSIPDSVTGIGAYAFCKCSGLTSVVIPSGVTELGEGAFEGCTGLRTVTFPDSLAEIDEGVFDNCDKQLTVICSRGSHAWAYCKKNHIRVKEPAESSRPGFFGRLLGRK